ncbi:MAG: hypothetical protein CL433_03270 [Acidimicrobiaceae bacterium]|nr:hypothetical protein [Acidimicrobiaceae bacterium]
MDRRGAHMTDTAAPITRSERITNLDTVRGIATLGILVMNAVSFGLPQPAYFNLDYAGSDTALDWIVGVLSEVFVDQKTMAMFSMLFGAGIVVFADRAAAKGRRANWLSLWRNTLLLGIGLVHAAFWFGDVLMLYAVCSPVLLLLRTRSARTLFIAGGVCIALSALTMAAVQGEIEAADLGEYWVDENTAMGEDVGFAFIVDFGMRALGAMLIGVGLFRADIIQGRRPAEFYRHLAARSFGIGMPLSILGVAIHLANDWSPNVALVGAVPNILATVPMSIGYIALITLWNQRDDTRLHERVRAVGRMALTNYLTQTIMGLIVLSAVIGIGELGRAEIFVFVLVVWAVQLAWSEPWLERFRFGPFEWLWRVATYRKLQPIRR